MPVQADTAKRGAIIEGREMPFDGFPAKTYHPAKFPDAVLDTLVLMLQERWGDGGNQTILDPFAGTGRIHTLQDHGWKTWGVEIEHEWADPQPNTICGDSTTDLRTILRPHVDPRVLGEGFHAIVTSPPWANGMGQRSPHTNDKGQSTRFSYADGLGRRLCENNTGALRWGPRYRELVDLVWRQCADLLAPGGLMVVDNRDSTRTGTIQPVTAWHITTLHGYGLKLAGIGAVAAQGVGQGSQKTAVGNAQLLVSFTKPDNWTLPGE